MIRRPPRSTPLYSSAASDVYKRQKQYLLGRQFVVRTDHAALSWLRKTPDPIGQQARWLEQIEEYTFRIEHRPGERHRNADALSRHPCLNKPSCTACHPDVLPRRVQTVVQHQQQEAMTGGSGESAKIEDTSEQTTNCFVAKSKSEVRGGQQSASNDGTQLTDNKTKGETPQVDDNLVWNQSELIVYQQRCLLYTSPSPRDS